MSGTETSAAGSQRAAVEGEPSIQWVAEFVGQWLEAWNSHRADRVLDLLTEDVEVRDDSWPKVMHGHIEVGEFLQALSRAVPDMTFVLVDGPYVIPGEPRASFRWRGSGTFTGPMDPPGFAPTERQWDVDGADFHEYRDGRIGKLRVVLDMMTVARQLGVMPAAGSRGERLMAAAQRGGIRVQQAYRRRRTGERAQLRPRRNTSSRPSPREPRSPHRCCEPLPPGLGAGV